jgi:hypothetical protein
MASKRPSTHSRARARVLCLGLALAAALTAFSSTAWPSKEAKAKIEVILIFDGSPLGDDRKMVWVDGLGRPCALGYTTVTSQSVKGTDNVTPRGAVANTARQHALVPVSRTCTGSRPGSSTFVLKQGKRSGFEFEGWSKATGCKKADRCPVPVAPGHTTTVRAIWLVPY